MCKHLFAQGSYALARDQLSRFVSEVDADAVARRSLLASRSHRKLALWLSGDVSITWAAVSLARPNRVVRVFNS